MLYERLSTQVILFTQNYKNQNWRNYDIKAVFPIEELINFSQH